MVSSGEAYRNLKRQEEEQAKQRARKEAESHRRYLEAEAKQEREQEDRQRVEDAKTQQAQSILDRAVKGNMKDLKKELPRGAQIVEGERGMSLVWDHQTTTHPGSWAAESTEVWKSVDAQVNFDGQGNPSLSIGGQSITDASQIPSALAKGARHPSGNKVTHWKRGQESKGPPDPGGQGRYS